MTLPALSPSRVVVVVHGLTFSLNQLDLLCSTESLFRSSLSLLGRCDVIGKSVHGNRYLTDFCSEMPCE